MVELSRPEKDAKKPADNSIVLRDVRFSYKKDFEDCHTDSILLTQNQEKKETVQNGDSVGISNPCGNRNKEGGWCGNEVLHGISMTLPQGSYTAFVGPAGRILNFARLF